MHFLPGWGRSISGRRGNAASADPIGQCPRAIPSRAKSDLNDTMLRGIVIEPTRQRILELALASHAGAIAEAQQHAHQATNVENPGARAGTQGKLQSLSAEEALEVGAVASLIIHSGSTPRLVQDLLNFRIEIFPSWSRICRKKQAMVSRFCDDFSQSAP
jgi:hypothetical protein